MPEDFDDVSGKRTWQLKLEKLNANGARFGATGRNSPRISMTLEEWNWHGNPSIIEVDVDVRPWPAERPRRELVPNEGWQQQSDQELAEDAQSSSSSSFTSP